MSLKGKVALITGGSRGIGAATVLKLAELGAHVAIGYGKSMAEADKVVTQALAKGVKAKAYQADQQDGGAVRKMVQQAAKDFGKIDILVNNAGVYGGAHLSECTEAEFDRVYQINVRSVFVAAQEALKHMPDGGRIINVGSVLGERGLFPGMTAYGMSKFAVSGLTRAWAWDLGPRGITVNCVEPGPTNTDMNPENGDGADGQRQATALGRYSQPADIAAVIAFLSSDEARNITGACYNVDGGLLA